MIDVDMRIGRRDMKIVLRINNRAVELQLNWLRYTQAVKYSNQIEEAVERPLFDARPPLTTVPEKDYTFVPEDNVSSGEAEIHKDIQMPGYIPCPCLAGPQCEECGTDYHSGGCTILGCVASKIYDACFCTRVGFNKCFECTADSEPHSVRCTNCNSHTA